MILRGILTFKLNAQWENVTLPLVRSLAQLETFAQGLQIYTDAQIVKATFMQIVYYDDLLATAENSTDTYAVALLENLDVAENRRESLAFPAPKSFLWDPESDAGPRILKDHGEAMAELYTALTDMEHRFKRGWKAASRP